MTVLHLLLQLLGCCTLGLGASGPRFQPPPLLVTCWGPHREVSQQQDEEHRVSCLWNSTMILRYQPASGARPKAEQKEGWPPPPPRCSWYLNSAWMKNTWHWSGWVVLQTGLLPGSTPPPSASSLLTVQCSSISCTAPECFHHNTSIKMSGQDMRLFVLWPQTHLIHVWQHIELGWCARFKSASWEYLFSSQGSSPSTLLVPSMAHQDRPQPAIYPTAELQQTCATYYNYRLTVRYMHQGLHIASVSIKQMPHISLSLSLKVEPGLQRILSISSRLLSIPRQPLSLSWKLQPLTLRTLAYKLVDTEATGGWLHSFSSFTLQSNFCDIPTTESQGEVVVASIYFPVDGRKFRELSGELHLLNGTLSLTAGKETTTHVNLYPGKDNSSTYIFKYKHGTLYATKENISPISTDGPNTRTVFYQQEELSYLVSIEFVAFQWYKFNMYLYMNQKRPLFRSLAEKDLEVHVFSSGRPSSLHSFTYLVWFIPAQHPMLQCEWTFHLQLFGTQEDGLLQNRTYTYKDHVRNAKRFVRSALPFDPEKYAGFVAKVNCNKKAFRPALLRVKVNNYAAKNIEAPVACQKEACYIDTVYIQRPVRNAPLLRQKRSASFFLFVRLLVDCNVGIFIKPLWRIYRVKDMKTPPDWTRPMNSSLMHGVDMIRITVPSFTLDYGLYLFYFTVEITPIRTTTVLRGSDQIYIQIDNDDLVANIAGGTHRTVGFSDNWTLDASASYDPDSQEGLEGVTFTWYCTKQMSDYIKLKLSPGKSCHPSQRDLKWLTSSDPVQVMPPEFLPGNALYYFRLVIEKDGRKSFADQTVNVQPGSPLLLAVACLENCGSTLIPTERFSLSGKCQNCRTHSHPIYYWSLFSENSTEISFDWSSRTSTGRYGAYLSIHALTFTKTAHQSYILQLKVTTWDGRSSIYSHAFKVNSPPRAGKCTISPHRGIAFLTKFVVQCSGFSDSNLPLTYKVIVASNVPKTTKVTSVEENTFGTILYFGYQPKSPPSFLPVGVPSEKYTLTLYVQVYDSLGAFTQVTLYVRVQNPVNSRPLAFVFHKLLASVSGLSAPMTSYLQTGDNMSAGYLTYLAASVLNYIKATPTLPLSKAQFRENLIKTTLNISVESPMEVRQVVASLSQVTEEADEVNIHSQDFALQKLTEVTEMLKIQRNENHWSEDAEIQTSGILRCLSNILRAALLRRRNVNVNGVKEVISIMENLTDIVFQGKVPGETETLMETKHWNITLQKDEAWNIENAFSPTRNACRNCFYPSMKNRSYSGLPHDAVVSTALFEFDENPFPWLGYTSEIATTVFGFKMAETKANGDLRGIVPEGAEITVARRNKESSTFQLAMGPDKTQTYTTGGFVFEASRNTKSIYIQILTKLKVTFQVLVFTVANITHAHPIASFDAFHNMSTVASKNETDSADCNIKGPYLICLPESLLRATAQGSATETYNISIVLLAPYIVRYQNQKLVSIHLFSDQCLFLDGVQSPWREDMCKLGSLTNLQRVHCICNMKQIHTSVSADTVSRTSTFDIRFLAAKVLVSPNTVDLGKTLIAEIPKNPVTFLTVLFIFGSYFFLSLWAMRKDKADRDRKDKIIVLLDNDPFDKASFLVTLYTGSRWGAGTTADVFLQLIGQNGMSDVHCLRHPDFPSFQQGSMDCFLLTTKKDLGDICSFRVWHNNKGQSPNWFLSRAQVENIATGKTWFFLCRKWLSLDKDDHLIERTFSVTNPKTSVPRIDYFLINFTNRVTEGHLWFSIFATVLNDNFTRLQRLSSCLALLLLNLNVNIMFFNADKNEQSPRHVRFLRSLTIGIECALITKPVEILIKALFRYSQAEPSTPGVAQMDPKRSSPPSADNLKNWNEHQRESYLSESSAQSKNIIPLENLPDPSYSQNPPRSKKRRSKGVARNQSNCTVSERNANVIATTEEQTIIANFPPIATACQTRTLSNSKFSATSTEEGGNFQKEEKATGISTPSYKRSCKIVYCWCVYLAWLLVIAITGITSFFIVLYGLSYGYETSLEWLLASAVSFTENVFLLSNLKISFLSAMNTIRPKYCENIKWLTRPKYLKLPEETRSAEEMREMHLKLVQIRSTKLYKPLEADEIANMMKTAEIKVKAFNYTKDLISHLVFLMLLLNFAYSAENANSFYYNQFIHDQFSPQLSSVDKLEHIYVWVKDSLLPLIHNDIQPTFLPESSSKIIGLPRMKQIRAKGTEKKCFHPHSFGNNSVIRKSHCLHKYGTDIPEKDNYAGTWTEVAIQSVSKGVSSYSGFTYQRNKTPWMYYSYGDLHTYGPAGYTFYFFPEEGRANSTTRLDALQQNNWLDEKTWSVIIELTVFNPDVDLFCTISVIFEMSHFGIIKPSLSVNSFALPLLHQRTKAQTFVFVIVLAFLLIYSADELYIINKEKKDYIKNIFNIINFGLKATFLLSVFLKIVKFKMGADIVNFYLLHPNNFIPFHAVSHLDKTLRITMGFLTFLVLLKTLKFSQFIYNVRLAQRSISAALPVISSIALVVVVYLFAFMIFGYLVFGQHEWNYNNMIHSAQTIFSYCVSAFRDTAFLSNRLLGSLFLASFMMVMICVLINLFQAIIISGYRDMKQPVYEEPSHEAQAATVVLQRLRSLFYCLLCKKSKTSKPDIFHSVLYGQPKKRHQQRLGLKNRKINGKKLVYIVI
ncbi:polycystin family receptor for egg jelly [Porphyrio hochstetteri]